MGVLNERFPLRLGRLGRVSSRSRNRVHHVGRWFVLGLFTFFLITACGGNVARDSTSNGTQSSPAECQTIQHQLGETCVPLNPQHIVATDKIALEIVLAVGLNPIGAAEPNQVGSRSLHLPEKVDDVVSLGKTTQLSLERILQLNPDLILGAGFSLENNYDQLSQIAPTVAFENDHDAWKATLGRIGEWLSRNQQAQQRLENYQDRFEKLQRAMGYRLDKTEVSVVHFYADGRIKFRDSSSFPGSVLEDVGLSRPALQYKTNLDVTTNRSVVNA
ncbi:MAG: iron siderophore-binding protein [Cyanobacteria bacterium QH_6_48_35]|nr:MAG: iron siderophore-binding protein [Cyanobacteria bacterium QH_1_48_107]PSO55085.1 MAG: iron siderophore-binding protein [Cyanobacteria bacterium QH_10_48_56]PSO63809.1 MAG: iron siderophore-binding protein [Cyanobacteria bacterium QH_6_48_35]